MEQKKNILATSTFQKIRLQIEGKVIYSDWEMLIWEYFTPNIPTKNNSVSIFQDVHQYATVVQTA